MRSWLTVAIGSALACAGLVVAAACAQEPAHAVTVEMRGFAFVPARVEVGVGDSIVFVNKDALPHTATANDGAWDSGQMNANDRWAVVATDPGTIEYICAYHPTMRGTVVVRDDGR